MLEPVESRESRAREPRLNVSLINQASTLLSHPLLELLVSNQERRNQNQVMITTILT